METRTHRHNRRKYSLKVHIVLVTKYRKQLFQAPVSRQRKQKMHDIANAKGYEVIARETDKDPIHFLLGYDTTDRVPDIVATIKQQMTCSLWKQYRPFLSKYDWSDGYFVCSMGEVSGASIRRYIES